MALAAYGADSPPNLVIITLDTVRADRLGCYGYKLGETPNLDRLAGDGIRFANAYTPVPITLPAHAVLFSGRYPMDTGIHDFSGNHWDKTQPTLASLLRKNAYATGAVVGSAVLDSRFGLNHGFEFYYDNFDFSRLDERNLDAMERPGSEVVDRAIAWLEANQQRPFFLFVHLYDAHHPYSPPAPYSQGYPSRPYDGEIAFVDAQVGRLLSSLKKMGLYDKAVIVVAGDHGESLGEHGEKTHGFFIYPSTLHVPLILKMPPGSRRNAVVSDPVSLVDVMPTLLNVLGVPPPTGVQGKDLAALLRGETSKEQREIYAETYLPRIHFNWSELRGIRFGRYFFIEAPRPELYDVARDPKQLKNLYSQQRAVANELRKRLARIVARYSLASPQKTAERDALDPILAERLKSLGYVAVSPAADAVLSDRGLPDPKDRIQTYELVSEAMADSQRGRYAESIAKLRQAQRTEKNSLPVQYLLALNYYRGSNFPSAIQALHEVLKLSPNYTLANFYLGLAYARVGDWNRSIAALQRTLQLDPTNFSAAYNLGVSHLKKGQSGEAVAAFRRSVSINPNYAAGHEALGEMLLYQGDAGGAITALRTALQLAPENANARLSLVKALEAKGLKQEAEEELRKATKPDRR